MTASVILTSNPGAAVTLTSRAAQIALTTRQYSITVAAPGPQGKAGSSITTVTVTAGETISGHRAVRIANGIAWLADSSDLAQIGQVSGISATAAIVGTSVDIQVGGEMTEPTWAFNPGRIWVGTNGLLTQTPPAVGFQQVIAQAISATHIIINIDSPFVLGA